MLRPSESLIESTREQALRLLSEVIEGFSLHPFFFILNVNVNSRVDPPVLPFAHQVELLFKLAFRRPVRILIGDEIGLGKTVEAILTIMFLGMRDGVRRVLILVPRILVEQWRSELKRFGIHARVIERRNIPILAQQNFPEGWYIASIDLVKREEYRPRIVGVEWDVVVVDEAHRVGKVGSEGGSVTQRYKLMEELAKVSTRNLILLSATPHRGHAEDYILRLKLVDPFLIGERELDNDAFYRLTRNSIVVRRTKMDVNDVYERKQVFRGAKFIARVIAATREETEFNELLLRFLREKLLRYYEVVGLEPKALPLLLALIAKRASSSPYAALKTFERILSRRSLVVSGKALSISEAARLNSRAKSIIEAYLGLGFEDYSELEDNGVVEPDEPLNEFVEEASSLLEDRDIEVVRRLFELAKTIVERGDSRLRGVMRLVREHLDKGDRIVIFTEYKDTAEYVYSKFKDEMPELHDKIAVVTSEKILIPGWREPRRPTIEDLKNHLRQGLVKLIISTDVASEGLNLQVANVIVNYEPSWSPVKIEQRLGRVWRLGQERDVISYTLFLAVRSDRDVLDVLYKKLLAWGRSLQETRVAIGEEVIIDMMAEDNPTIIPLDVKGGVPRYSEYKALITYIRNGRNGLEEYVQSIINALTVLRKSLERVGLTRRSVAFKIESLLANTLGDFRGDSVELLLRDLFIVTAKLSGLDVKIRNGRVFAGTFKLENIHDYHASILALLRTHTGSVNRPIYILSSAQLEGMRELHLFKVIVYFKGKPVYSEVVGLAIKSNPMEADTIRGSKLLRALVDALSPDKIVSGIQEYHVPPDFIQNLRAKASMIILNNVVREAVSELRDYMTKLEELGLSSRHQDWEPRDLQVYSGSSEYIGAVIFTSSSEPSGVAPPPFKVKEVEEIAMKVAMDYEKSMGRIPEDVSSREHYDIRSIDPRTGEVRYIEVKGKSGLNLEVELTETEFEFAREKGDRYWLYIVYGIGTSMPRLLAIQDPVNRVRWSEVSIKRYRLKPG